MTTTPDSPNVLGPRHAAAALTAAYQRDPAREAPGLPVAVAAVAWLRERTLRTVRTATPPRAAYDAAVPLARELHKAACTWTAAKTPCPALASVTAAVAADAVSDTAGDDELGAALAADPGDTVNAFAAFTAAVIVAVDGPGAGAVIAGLRAGVT